MPKNTLEDLRNHLFITLENLTDEKATKDPEALKVQTQRAKAVVDVSRTIIEAARTENDFMKITGEAPATDFFGKRSPDKRPLLPPGRKPNGGALRA
jgi:hypothetical protein